MTRGLSSTQIGAYEKWSSAQRSPSVGYGSRYVITLDSSTLLMLFVAVTSSVHGLAYPLPSSFPTLTSDRPSPYTEMSSSLSTSRNLTALFEGYAMFIDKCVSRRTTSLASIDVSLDDLKELANDLWTMHDNSSGETDELFT